MPVARTTPDTGLNPSAPILVGFLLVGRQPLLELVNSILAGSKAFLAVGGSYGNN